MIRKFNYTNRQKLRRSDARVSLPRVSGDQYQVDASIDLEPYSLPSTASVFVEAYHGPLCKRYHWGLVGQPSIPDDRALPRLADPETILFRVKIVDERDRHGRIIAVADRIHPLSPEEAESKRVPLLHVRLDENMGDRIWKLDFTADWPELHLNKHVEGMKAIVRTDIQFLSLVFPAVVRQILKEIVVTQSFTDPYCDDDDWQTLWLRFVVNLPGVPGDVPETQDDAEEWIETAVDAFCAYHRTRERYAACLKEMES